MKKTSILLCLLPLATLFAQAPDYPVYVSQISNPNDYSIFANGGWDGNWYVGYNNGWVKKLPMIPSGNYAHAYIGAKLGRMKTLPPLGKPPVFNPVPGEIWMALASAAAWTANNRFLLTSTEDIPLEASPEFPLEHTGESEWFWTEVPMKMVNFTGDNFLALWSPSPALISVSSAPVLAAAWGNRDINSWVANDINGTPPTTPAGALKTGISVFQPALALKLVPAGDPHLMRVRVVAWKNGTADHLKPILSASAEGDSIQRVWVEYDHLGKTGDVVRGQWTQVGRSLWKAPYLFTLDQEKLPHGKLHLRVAAVNVWEEKSYSDPFEIDVSPVSAKK